MSVVLWILDIVLCGSLVWLASQAVATSDLFKAIVLFIQFGLVMTLAWVRLDAPDIALAEAAIGAGLTGALFLSTFTGIRERVERTPSQPLDTKP